MRSRSFVVGSALAVFLAWSGPAMADTELPLCDSTVMIECVVSVKAGGVVQDYPSDGDPYNISIRSVDPGGAYDFAVNITGVDGGPLTMGQEWEVAVNLGTHDPGETFSRGREVTVVRGGSATSRTLTMTLKPVRMAEGPCSSAGACPLIATLVRDGYLESWIGDLSYLSDPDDRAAMRGFDFASSAEWTSSPPQLDPATHAIVIDVANTHFEPGGSSLFVGSAELKLPFPMLSRIYDVDDPASLTPAAFAVTAGTGSAPTISVVVGTGSVKVTLENLTFSKRRLRIKGDVRPGLPRSPHARRTTATNGAIWFMKALPRGAKVRGYEAVCRAGSHIVRGSAVGSPVRLHGLTSARHACTVRAKSKAGLGRIARVSIPPR